VFGPDREQLSIASLTHQRTPDLPAWNSARDPQPPLLLPHPTPRQLRRVFPSESEQPSPSARRGYVRGASSYAKGAGNKARNDPSRKPKVDKDWGPRDEEWRNGEQPTRTTRQRVVELSLNASGQDNQHAMRLGWAGSDFLFQIAVILSCNVEHAGSGCCNCESAGIVRTAEVSTKTLKSGLAPG